MNILVLGDPHFKNDNLYFMTWTCQEILEIIDQTEPDLVVCLGDTLDDHERVHLRPLTMATKFFFAIADRCPLVVIIGNHDRENNSDFLSDCQPFIGLTRTPNITVVDHVVWDRRLNFIYVPYVPPGRFQDALATVGYYPGSSNSTNIPSIQMDGLETDPSFSSQGHSFNPSPDRLGINGSGGLGEEDYEESTENDSEGEVIFDKPRLIFAHQEFVGCTMGTVRSIHGDGWSDQWPLIISGHIHEYQTLPRVIYVGTFFQQNYGESPDKAIMLVQVDEGEHGDRLGELTINRIRLTSVCLRQTIDLNMAELDDFISKIPVDSIRSQDLEKSSQKITGTLVRVRLHVDAAQIKTLKSNPSYIALESMVDKISPIPECDRASLALSIIPTNNPQEISQFSLEQMVREMIKDDPVTLELFEQEILTNHD